MNIKALRELVDGLPDDVEVVIRHASEDGARPASGFVGAALQVKHGHGNRVYDIVDATSTKWVLDHAVPVLVLEP